MDTFIFLVIVAIFIALCFLSKKDSNYIKLLSSGVMALIYKSGRYYYTHENTYNWTYFFSIWLVLFIVICINQAVTETLKGN